ncbi:MAG TPA: hypothetical protein VI756_24750 [Blastocatellia bacterium]
MFCPNCGADDRGRSRFCRGCGAELDLIRKVVDRPDAVTESAVSARDEVGRAIADKIREIDSAKDLRRVLEDTLPLVEKFLESPEERRLRHIRDGMATASTGLGIALFGIILAYLLPKAEQAGLLLVGAASLVFLIGVGIVIGGLFFTIPRSRLSVSQRSTGELLRELSPPAIAPDSQSAPPSVIEGTTYSLKDIDRTTAPR